MSNDEELVRIFEVDETGKTVSVRAMKASQVPAWVKRVDGRLTMPARQQCVMPGQGRQHGPA